MEKKKNSLFREMSSFTKDGQFKSSFFVYSVCLSFLFIAVHILLLKILVSPIHNLITGLTYPVPTSLWNLFESGIPALLSAILCNLPFFIIRDKRLILAAYALILVYIVIIVIVVLCIYESGARFVFMFFLWMVVTAPVVCGFLVSGCVYAVYLYRQSR